MARGRRNHRPTAGAPGPLAEEESLVVARWMLRLLVHDRLVRPLSRERGTLDWSDVYDAVELRVSRRRYPPPANMARVLARRLDELEEMRPSARSSFFTNLDTLARLLGLSEVERDVLAFCVKGHTHAILAKVLELREIGSTRNLGERMARALGHPGDAVRRALGARALLRGGGLLDDGYAGFHGEGPHEMPRPSARVREVLFGPPLAPDEMFQTLAPIAPPAERALEDFDHLADEVALLVRVLCAARETRERVNVLLHGPPGTGKTELTRALAARLGAPLYPVRVEDDDGDPVSADGRLTSYRLLQCLLGAAPDALVLFDEIEDVFPVTTHPLFGPVRQTGRAKGFVNRLLEAGTASTIWISNEVDQIDPAYLRRFDLAIEMGTPPKAVRRRILGEQLGRLPVGEAQLDRLAADETITPAEANRIERVLRLSGTSDEAEAGQLLDRVLAARAGTRGTPASSPTGELRYDLRFVRADVDLTRLIGGLARDGRGTLLLEGPPGCGKTAFVSRIADALDRPLLWRAASDLLGCFVGQTEANLAEMFRRARREGAVLFLDEADSFLQSRARAFRTWEVTQVNELLVQMERFDGIFVCATNLVDALDEASKRRFSAKVRFEPPDAGVRWQLFLSTLRSLAGSSPRGGAATAARRELSRMDGLVVGDYVAAARRMRLLDERPTAPRLLEALRGELAHKRDRTHAGPIGFR